jgi:hypothetical protein
MTAVTSPDSVVAVEGESIREFLERHDHDRAFWNIVARVDKYDLAAIERAREFFALAPGQEPTGAQLAAVAAPVEVVIDEGNLLTRQGRKRLIDRLVGTASNQALDSAHCRIGTGNSTTAAVDTDTDLNAAAGSSNRQFQLVDSTPTVGSGASSGVFTGVATFGTGVGNYAWQEWGIDGGTASGTTVTAEGNTTPGLCNHKVSSLGTKTSAASWVFTITITIT